MNLFLAFFHGEQALVGFLFAGIIVLICVPLVFYVWLWRTRSSPLKLTLIYLVSTAVLCVLSLIPTENPISLFHVTTATLTGILTLPWNVITLLPVALSDISEISRTEGVVAVLLGAGVNAWILFFLATKARRWKG